MCQSPKSTSSGRGLGTPPPYTKLREVGTGFHQDLERGRDRGTCDENEVWNHRLL